MRTIELISCNNNTIYDDDFPKKYVGALSAMVEYQCMKTCLTKLRQGPPLPQKGMIVTKIEELTKTQSRLVRKESITASRSLQYT